jgi:hypothetical protein
MRSILLSTFLELFHFLHAHVWFIGMTGSALFKPLHLISALGSNIFHTKKVGEGTNTMMRIIGIEMLFIKTYIGSVQSINAIRVARHC